MKWILLFLFTVPCEDIWPLSGWGFDEFQPGIEYAELSSTFDGVAITLTPQLGYAIDPPCLLVRGIDQDLHHDVLTTAGVDVDVPVVLDFWPHVWRLVVYVSADGFDDERRPCLRCWGTLGDEVGGDCGGTTFAPEAWLPDPQHPTARPFQYLVSMPPHENPLPGNTIQPIDYCVLDPDGSLFIGLIQVDDQPYGGVDLLRQAQSLMRKWEAAHLQR